MNIAELFVNIGVTGTDKTVGALSQVKNTISDAVSSAIEAKAALFGVLYALEKLISAAGTRGTELKNLSTFLGVNTKELQQFEYAAKMAGSSAEEMDQNLVHIKKTLSDIALNKGVPDWFSQFANTLKKFKGIDIKKEDVKKLAAHPTEFIELYQTYSKFEKDKTLRDAVLTGMGLSPTFIATLEKQSYTRDKLAKAHLLSDKNVSDLDKARANFTDFNDSMTVSSEKLIAKWGPKVTAEMVKLLPSIEKLADAFGRILTNGGGLQLVGKTFEGWSIIFEGWVKTLTFVNDLLLDLGKPGNFEKAAKTALGLILGDKDMSGNNIPQESDDLKARAKIGEEKSASKRITEKTKDWKESHPEKIDKLLKLMKGEGYQAQPGAKESKDLPNEIRNGSILPNPSNVVTPKPPPSVNNGKTQASNINIEQNLNFQHSGQNSQQTAYDVQRATRETFRQLHAQAGGV